MNDTPEKLTLDDACRLMGQALPFIDSYRRTSLGDGDIAAHNLRCFIDQARVQLVTEEPTVAGAVKRALALFASSDLERTMEQLDSDPEPLYLHWLDLLAFQHGRPLRNGLRDYVRQNGLWKHTLKDVICEIIYSRFIRAELEAYFAQSNIRQP